MPPVVAAQIASLTNGERTTQKPPVTEDKPAATPSFMPSPKAAAIAVMAMLAFGVVIGSATSQLAQSAGLASIVLELAPQPAAPTSKPVETTASAPEPEPVETATASVEPAPVEEVLPEEPAPEEPAPEPKEKDPFFEEEESGLPGVKHVFLIVLGENDYEESFGASSAAPYLSVELPAEGELIPNYYAVTKGALANQIALISGQGPTLETAANCPNYADVVPATVSASAEQVEGAGCVYPAATQTLPAQLLAAKMKWRAYLEDSGNGVVAGQPPTCRHPALGTPDLSQAPVPGDAYVTWRNPFVYFHSLIDAPECAEADVGLDRLAADLAKKVSKQTPALSYIVPNACHKGGELPCEPGQLAGPVAAEEFLKTVVPEIQASPAFKEGGLIAITSSQAQQAGERLDSSACCATPVYPNLPPEPESVPAAGGIKPAGGGGKVGLLLISPFVEAGGVNETGIYNHFSLLLTIEELFGLEKLGYAAEPALLPFDETVFNAGTEGESTVAKRPHGFGRLGWVSRAGSAAR
ncbi:MAG: hypothetical protein H0X42_04200 [Solirubrobacterales bacterium]|nr:hypothetical protein [Solirubrobacterales bacterium]